MQYEVETIYPDTARDWLRYNTWNRPLSPKMVDRYAAAMKRGEWSVNGESIKFSGRMLVDGQHRLEGCLKAGRPFKTLVIRGLPKNARKTVDCGGVRTNAHFLAMEGELYYKTLAQSIAWAMNYDANKIRHREKLTHSQIEKYLRDNPDLREYVHRYGPVKITLLPKAMVASLHYVFSRINSEQADIFMDGVLNGIGLTAGSPMLVLRNRLIAELNHQRGMRSRNYVKFALTLKAWNLFRKGEKCKQISFRVGGSNTEEIPKAL
jgi:hypothetical protein